MRQYGVSSNQLKLIPDFDTIKDALTKKTFEDEQYR